MIISIVLAKCTSENCNFKILHVTLALAEFIARIFVPKTVSRDKIHVQWHKRYLLVIKVLLTENFCSIYKL